MQGFYDYSNRKPQPKIHPHTGKYTEGGDRQYSPACLCQYCLAEHRRRNPGEYAVFQAAPAKGARTVDLTDGTLPAHLWTSPPTKYPQNGKRAAVKLAQPVDKTTHVIAAVVLHL